MSFRRPKVEVDPEDTAKAKIKEKLKSRTWRLNNLYYIVGQHPTTGKPQKIKFKPNWAQQQLLSNLWYFSIILKARQLGFTTLICILALDLALFEKDKRCGIIAHNREDAEDFFSNKVRYAYDNLPQWIKDERKAPNDSKVRLSFNNGSSIRVGTSLRSGTYDLLHISEFGKVCARAPEKAREIVTGGINTVHEGGLVFIESTAEGREGQFFDFCEEAKRRMLSGAKLMKQQFKFFFFPWWKDDRYQIDPDTVIINEEMQDYFRTLASKGIVTTPRQQAWYVVKQETQRDDMKREFPSTPAEAFEAAIVGAYYARQMASMRMQKRITRVDYDPLYPVNTFWDIGLNDMMSIWFHQRVGAENRIIDYMEGTDEGLGYYARRLLQEKEYIYDTHYMPHDAAKRSANDGERFDDYARKKGLRNIRMIPRAKNAEEVLEGIEATRNFLDTCIVDETKCDKGIKGLDNYRKEWDGNLGAFKRTPLHNWASNPADSMRCGAVGFKALIVVSQEELEPEWAEDM
jgi:hypothetical protein